MFTDLTWVQPGARWPPDDKDTTNRLALYARNKSLYEGDHLKPLRLREVLQRANDLDYDRRWEITLVLNWFRRLSQLWADMMWGEAPKIKVGDEGSQEQAFLDQLIRENDLFNEGQQVTIDQSRFGTGVWKIRYDGNRVVIQAQTPTVWHRVVRPDDVKDITAHVLAWEYETRIDGRKEKRLQVEIHTPGKVERHLYKVSGSRIGDEVPPDNYLGIDQAYGIPGETLIVPVDNALTSEQAYGYDDYTDLIPVVQGLEAALSQVAAIIQRHADPKLTAPPSSFRIDPISGQRSVAVSGPQAMEVAPGEAEPKYLTWDAQLTAVFKHIETIMEQIYTLSETSPAAFGQLKAGLAESGSALQRLLMAPLIKTNRLRNRMDRALKHAIWLASKLAVDRSVSGAVELSNIQIDWRDGLPQDMTEAINQESTAYTAGLTSLESALRRLYGLEGQQLKDELQRIAEEQEAKAPPLPVQSRFDEGDE